MREQRKRPRRKRAVALGYDQERDAAPRVLAKGQGVQAERILEVARTHGVHIQQDADLAELLGRLEVDTTIPEALYQAAAQVLALVYRINQRFERP